MYKRVIFVQMALKVAVYFFQSRKRQRLETFSDIRLPTRNASVSLTEQFGDLFFVHKKFGIYPGDTIQSLQEPVL